METSFGGFPHNGNVFRGGFPRCGKPAAGPACRGVAPRAAGLRGGTPAKADGILKCEDLRLATGPEGEQIVLNKNGVIRVYDKTGREAESHTIQMGSVLAFADGATVKKGDFIAKWDPYNEPILSEHSG